VLGYFMDSGKEKSSSTADYHADGNPTSHNESLEGGGFTHRSCSEVFVFGAYSTEKILGEVGRAPTIQFTGGRVAYNVVDEAS
jgi:hypothetical protein